MEKKFKGFLGILSPGIIILGLMYFTGYADFLVLKHFLIMGSLIIVLVLDLIPASLILVMSSEMRLGKRAEVLVYLGCFFFGVFGIVYIVESNIYLVNIEAISVISFGLILIPIMLIYSVYSAERINRDVEAFKLKSFITVFGFEPELNGGTIDEFIRNNLNYNYIKIYGK